MLQKASEEMDATMIEINETEDMSGKNKRNETIVEKGRQGIKVTQDEKEEGHNNREKTEDRNKELVEEGKSSDDEGESSDEEVRSMNSDNTKQITQARGYGMDKEMSDKEYSDSNVGIS